MLTLLRDGTQFLNIFTRLLARRPAKSPLAVYLELTKKCNYKCKFCDFWKLDIKQEFSFPQLKNVLDQCAEIGVKLLHVEGGEATLLPFFTEFVKEAAKRKIHLSLTTNGSRLTPAYTQKLVDAGLKTIAISIDSHIPEIHDASRGVQGAFERTTANIKEIKSRFPELKLWINHIVNRKNMDDLTAFIDFCITLEINTIYLLPVHNLYPIKYFNEPDIDLYITQPEDIAHLTKMMRDAVLYMKKNKVNTLSDTFYNFVPNSFNGTLPSGYCDEGNLVCEIDSSGNVYLCLPKKEIVGNVLRQRLGEIWRSEKANKVRDGIKNCNHCWYNCHIEPTIRFRPGYFLKHPLKMLKDYKMHLGP